MIEHVSFIDKLIRSVTSVAIFALSKCVEFAVVAEEHCSTSCRTDLNDVCVLLVEEASDLNKLGRGIDDSSLEEQSTAKYATPPVHSTIILQSQRKAVSCSYLGNITEPFYLCGLVCAKNVAQTQTITIIEKSIQYWNSQRSNRAPSVHSTVFKCNHIVVVTAAEALNLKAAEVLDNLGLFAAPSVVGELAVLVLTRSVQRAVFSLDEHMPLACANLGHR